MNWKKRLGLIARYVFINGIFGTCIYLGFYGELAGVSAETSEGAKNIGLFMAWVTGILSFVIVIALLGARDKMVDELGKEYEPSVPYIIDLVFDLFIIGTIIWFGHYVLAAFYLCNMWSVVEMRKLPGELILKKLKAKGEVLEA